MLSVLKCQQILALDPSFLIAELLQAEVSQLYENLCGPRLLCSTCLSELRRLYDTLLRAIGKQLSCGLPGPVVTRFWKVAVEMERMGRICSAQSCRCYGKARRLINCLD